MSISKTVNGWILRLNQASKNKACFDLQVEWISSLLSSLTFDVVIDCAILVEVIHSLMINGPIYE
jgi:hypothetical protein